MSQLPAPAEPRREGLGDHAPLVLGWLRHWQVYSAKAGEHRLAADLGELLSRYPGIS